MENKQLSLEDKVKPYLLLAKTIDFQIFNEKDEKRKEKRKELLITILFQLLKQVKFKDLHDKDYYDLTTAIDEKFVIPDFSEYEKENSTTIPLSTLIDKLRINSLSEIKEQLEKTEKELNNGK